ncbi:glycerol kinase GlpK [Tautonia sociabilis]|uniref:ATP:glycerol 3-phosphotransferase n=1 Tax=Tautonia sociabilis TaxID=2080755 RepID=A0A432MCW4_9BACT|nr:glycerol kinase GlpK [Tautonia sociabilis]RUL82340.1 glycerol kinase [Tautonia sociabilis]
MARDHILVIDQGTTSTRAVVYDTRLRPVGQGQIEVPPTYPKPGWVEHDPGALVDSVGTTVIAALGESGVGADRIAAIGLTNQRETTVLWDRATGEPAGPAIVWQDRRTAELCRSLASRADWLAERTGLLLDSYFSATKLSWMLDHLPGVRKRAEAGELAFGTVDSLVLGHLTGGRLHATDVTNASRTLLMDLRAGRWADDLCQFFGIPTTILPEIVPSSGEVGQTRGLGYLPDGLPIAGIAGDQQASLFGNGCVHPGQAKCTYGTGAFLLVNTGERVVRSTTGLVTTPAASPPGAAQQYALEGSVFIAGAAVQWFRDGLRAIGAAPEINPLSEEAAPDSEVLFVPALTGLGAPHWVAEARGTIFGITRATTVPDLARAVIEGVAYQIADLVEAMNVDLPAPLESLRADGGMARSDPFLRFQADLMGLPIRRSPQTEATALGAAALAGLGVGLWPNVDAVAALLEPGGDPFTPSRDPSWRRKALRRWRHAVETVVRHYRSH